MKYLLSLLSALLSALLFSSACTNAKTTCPGENSGQKDERNLEEEGAAKFEIGEHDDQTTINMTSYEETQYWKRKMKKRLAKIKQIYEKVDWTDALHKERFFKNLAASQDAFDAYLTAQVELTYPEAEQEEWWGSGIPPCINMIYTAHYKNRYFELKNWENGTPDGEMCGGTALTQFELEEMKK